MNTLFDAHQVERWQDVSAVLRCDCLSPDAVGCMEMAFERMRRQRRQPRTAQTEGMLTAIAFHRVSCGCACHKMPAHQAAAVEVGQDGKQSLCQHGTRQC